MPSHEIPKIKRIINSDVGAKSVKKNRAGGLVRVIYLGVRRGFAHHHCSKDGAKAGMTFFKNIQK